MEQHDPRTTFKLTLIENSRSFFCEALRKALDTETYPHTHQWKFAILNICQAIELSLKERLRREHPALIWKDVDKQKLTVTVDLAITRLEELCGVSFSKEDKMVIKDAKDWRNQIIHHEFSIEIEKLKPAFSTLLSFLTNFHKTILNEELSKQIDSKLWKKALSIQSYGYNLFERAHKQIKDKQAQGENVDFNNQFSCSHCGYWTLVFKGDTFYCYVCESEEPALKCEECGCSAPESRLLINRYTDQEYGNHYTFVICPECEFSDRITLIKGNTITSQQ